jgi:hypothetical protein
MSKREAGCVTRRAAGRIVFGLVVLGALVWVVALRVAEGAGEAAARDRVGEVVLRHAPSDRGSVRDVILPTSGPAPVPSAWAGIEMPEPEPERATAGEPDLVEALHARLVALEEQWPISWHDAASGALGRFSEGVGASVETKPEREELLLRLTRRIETESSARVHGGLLAALGGLGETDALLDLLPAAGEARRSGLVGLAWLGDGVEVPGREADPRAGVRLDPARFLQEQPRGAVSVLHLPMARIADPSTAAWLQGEIVRPADSLEELFARDLAVFALGTGVDRSAETRAFLRRLLFDTHPSTQRLRPSVSYVLAQARGREAREVLVAWLADPLVGELGKTMARWWMAEGHAMPGDVDALIAPLMDPTSDGHGRILAVGGLLRRLDRAGEAELQQIEDVLSLRVVTEEDDTPRLAAVTTLALAPGGWQRMAALEHSLRTDPKPACRGWAATGLGRTVSPHTAEAQAILRSALPFEQDPSVRGAIQRALGSGG